MKVNTKSCTYRTHNGNSNEPIVWEFLTNYANIVDQLLAYVFNCMAPIKEVLNIWDLKS